LTGLISDPLELDLLSFDVPEGELVEITVGDGQPAGPNFRAGWRLINRVGEPVNDICGRFRTGGNELTTCGPLRARGSPYRVEVGDRFRRDTGTYRVFLNLLTSGCPAQAGLSIALTGCRRCQAGDRLTVQARLTHTNTSGIPVEVKLGVRLPNGQPFNITTNKHLELTLSPSLDTTVTIFDISLPPGLPPGLWTFEGALLEPELGKTLSRNTQPFAVLP
jgi:hypothetical protein